MHTCTSSNVRLRLIGNVGLVSFVSMIWAYSVQRIFAQWSGSVEHLSNFSTSWPRSIFWEIALYSLLMSGMCKYPSASTLLSSENSESYKYQCVCVCVCACVGVCTWLMYNFIYLVFTVCYECCVGCHVTVLHGPHPNNTPLSPLSCHFNGFILNREFIWTTTKANAPLRSEYRAAWETHITPKAQLTPKTKNYNYTPNWMKTNKYASVAAGIFPCWSLLFEISTVTLRSMQENHLSLYGEHFFIQNGYMYLYRILIGMCLSFSLKLHFQHSVLLGVAPFC